jgi:hypothetical protein
MSSKVIKDIFGGELKLTQRRLVELDFQDSYEPWAADFADINRATPRKGVRIYETVKRDGRHHSLVTTFRRPTTANPTGRIGCREFSRETFYLIINAAKVAGTKAAKAARAGV